jgi:integrase
MVLKVAQAAAVARGEIQSNPARKSSRVAQNGVRLPRRRSKRDPVFLDRDEYALVLKAVPRRHHTLVEFLAATGCRLGEATALTPADVNLDTRKVRFNKIYRRRSTGDHGSRFAGIGAFLCLQ